MKTYFVDTNVFIRFLLNDHPEMYQASCTFFESGQKKQHRIVVLDLIFLEIEYVLRKVYQVPKSEIHAALKKLLSLEFLEINNRSVLSQTIETYKDLSLDLTDILLYFTAKNSNGEVFSFDKGYQKFKKAL